MCSRTRAGFTLNIIDTPGIVEGGYINEQALDIIKRYNILNRVSHLLKLVQIQRRLVPCISNIAQNLTKLSQKPLPFFQLCSSILEMSSQTTV